jgi:hypothetical protein
VAAPGATLKGTDESAGVGVDGMSTGPSAYETVLAKTSATAIRTTDLGKLPLLDSG